MKKLILHKHSSAAILIDIQTLEFKEIDRENNMIDYTYVSPCDCEILCGDRKVKADKGDIIFKLYSKEGKDVVVIKSEEFATLLCEYNKPNKLSKVSEAEPCDSCARG